MPTADLYGLDGKRIEAPPVAAVAASPEITEIIEHLIKLNEAGRIRAVAVAVVHDDDTAGNAHIIAHPVNTATLVGSLEILKSRITEDRSREKWINK